MGKNPIYRLVNRGYDPTNTSRSRSLYLYTVCIMYFISSHAFKIEMKHVHTLCKLYIYNKDLMEVEKICFDSVITYIISKRGNIAPIKKMSAAVN